MCILRISLLFVSLMKFHMLWSITYVISGEYTRAGNQYRSTVNTNFLKNSFMFKATQDWNSLPTGIRTIQSTATFKKHLQAYFSQQYSGSWSRKSSEYNFFIAFAWILYVILFCLYDVYAVLSRTPWETSLSAKGTLPGKKLKFLFSILMNTYQSLW